MDKYYNNGDCIKNYTICEKIGEGRYGIVYLVKKTQNNLFVMKQLKNDNLISTKDEFLYEKTILLKLNNSHFPKFIEEIDYKDIKGYILEYKEGVTFESVIVNNKYQFNKIEIYKIALKLIELIDILEQNNIVHRDIRLPNVLLQENQNIVLIDFGLARYIDNKRYKKNEDFWFLGDFLIHLYYTAFFNISTKKERPWFKELNLQKEEKDFLMRLMQIKGKFNDLIEVKRELKALI